MAGIAAQFIGLSAAGVLSTIPLIAGLFKPPEDSTTTIQIQMGQNANMDLDGDLPQVSLWDEEGRAIGSFSHKETLKAGNFKKIKIVSDPHVGNVPVSYVSISANGNNAACVSYITISQTNGDSITFSGDVGFQCGGQWYESSINLGTNGEHPKCLWIDGDSTTGVTQGFGFHVRDFFGTTQQGDAYSNNPDVLCKSGPRFRLYPKLKARESILFYDPPLEYSQAGIDKDISKVIGNPGRLTQIDDRQQRDLCLDPETRPLQPCDKCDTFPLPGVACDPQIHKRESVDMDDNQTPNDWMGPPSTASQALPKSTATPKVYTGFNAPPPQRFQGALVISDITVHSAAKLCASATSYGPDFVSTAERKFCDMKSKQVWDVCANQESRCCFDLEQKQLQSCAARVRRGLRWRQDVGVSNRTGYTHVQHW